MQEEWRDIVGYEGLYQVSNLGRVKSCARRVSAGDKANHTYNTISEKLLSAYFGNYVQVRLSHKGKTRCFGVHRLVASAFIPNPNGYPCVNHKDENKHNNCVENLEWCTYKYNNEYNGRLDKCKAKISDTLSGRTYERHLTTEQRKRISDGAKRGWETRRKHIKEDRIKEEF